MPSFHGTCRKTSMSFLPRTGRTSIAGSRSDLAIAMRGAQRSGQRIAYATCPSLRRRSRLGRRRAEAVGRSIQLDLKETVNLPKTAFPMRAALAEREPIQVRAWLEGKVYEKLVAQNEGRERFIL